MRKKTIIILIIILSVILGRTFYKDIKGDMAAATVLSGEEVISEEEYAESLKDIDSDIDGMTQYDKYMMGLGIEDGSDTDHDGLTDKEEIEKYESDPLKSSTAGDLYTDGYKASNDMDLTASYDMEEVSFDYNECSEVKLSADVPEDLMAVVEDYTDRYSLSDFGIDDIYKGYWLYNYSGTLSIDLASTLKKNDIEMSDVYAYIYKGDFLAYGLSDLEFVSYTADGDTITLDYDFDNSESYFVYVAGKQSSSFLKNIVYGTTYQLDKSTEDSPIILFEIQPIIDKRIVYYYGYDINDSSWQNYGKKAVYKESSKNFIINRYKMLSSTLPMFNGNIEGMSWNTFGEIVAHLYMIFYAYELDDEDIVAAAARDNANGELTEEKRYANEHTSFDVYEDELPFQNFKSEYGEMGNCTGIVYLTSNLFNNGTFPTSGEYNGISWDLSVDSENDTLSDPGLFDYKSRTFIDENSNMGYINDDISEGEKEFVKMIGACYQYGNDKSPSVYKNMISNDWSDDWELAEAMMSMLDSGKIFNIGIYLRDESAHQMIAYDYYFNSNDELIFRIYDPSFPQNEVEGVTFNCEGACYLQCKKVLRTDGTYGFTYLYYPIEDDFEYLAASCGNLMEHSSITCLDEDFEEIY